MDCESSVNEKMNSHNLTSNNCDSNKFPVEINNNDMNVFESSESMYSTYEADIVRDTTAETKLNSSITALVPKMENLELSGKINLRQKHFLAGCIKAVIPPTGTVVVQLALGSRILDIGTAIFLQDNDKFPGICEKYEEIGFISDVFGSILEPMYTLQLKQRITASSLRLNTQVFYLHEHSSTSYIKVRQNAESRYIVIHE